MLTAAAPAIMSGMSEAGYMETRGFVVHCYADFRPGAEARDRLYLIGRLEDGRSFAAVEENWRPSLHIY